MKKVLFMACIIAIMSCTTSCTRELGGFGLGVNIQQLDNEPSWYSPFGDPKYVITRLNEFQLVYTSGGAVRYAYYGRRYYGWDFSGTTLYCSRNIERISETVLVSNQLVAAVAAAIATQGYAIVGHPTTFGTADLMLFSH